MKILIIDNDIAASNLLKSRLLPMGHVVEIIEKNDDMDKAISDGWDVIMFDPSPLTTLRPTILGIRRANRRNAYLIMLSKTLEFQEALTSGFNDFLAKPIDMNSMLDKIDHAVTLIAIQRHLNDDKIDFPSAGGVIAKSAFNQLFLACMDRADRYGEIAHIVFISIDNYPEIVAEAGSYEANLVSAKLAHHLVRLRRQSDIISQIKENEYALLLLRPMTESEPLEAAHRFAEALCKCTDIPFDQKMSANIRVFLMRLPTGETGVEHRMAIYQAPL
jgi:PleD family two-component response regulator